MLRVAIGVPALVLVLALAALGQTRNDECLACHGVEGMPTESGKNIYVNPARHAGSVHGPVGCTTCHNTISSFPHPRRIPRVDCSMCHTQVGDVKESAHGALGAESCQSCHGNAHEIRAGALKARQQAACVACHADTVQRYERGIHNDVRLHGDTDGATCQSCHGPVHKILPQREAASPVAKKNLPDTCGACHANADFLARHRIPFAKPVEAFRLSVHGRAVQAGNQQAASCSDCHASHDIQPARNAQSKINHWNVPDTCGTCHTEIASIYKQSVHGQGVARGNRSSPVCTDCHGEHTILAPSEPQSLVNPARVSSVTCGRCHADERLAARYNLPLDKVPAYQDSFHGLSARAGSQTVANCASCHGVHNILPSSDPRSTIHPNNLAATCGTCHPGAGQRFAITAIHVRPQTASEHYVVRWIRVAYWILIPLTLGFMLFHHSVDFFRKLIRGSRVLHSGEQVPRMNLHFRIAHWLVMVSFPVLIITGFALKFPEAWWSAPLLHWEGQFAFRGTVHRTAGVILVIALVYHIVHLIVSRRDRALLGLMLPSYEDVLAAWGMIRYNLGWSAQRPLFGAVNYAEKLEYWAFLWGTVVMAISGFLLWFNNFTLRNFPKWVSDAAEALHYYEAILATFAILIWHMYIVIFDPDVYPMDFAWLTGKTSADHLRHTRPEYYLDLTMRAAAQSASAKSEAHRPAAAADSHAPASNPSGGDSPPAAKQEGSEEPHDTEDGSAKT